MPSLNAAECMAKALLDHPRDAAARRTRFVELLKEHGHVIDRPVGEGHIALPGWPATQEATR